MLGFSIRYSSNNNIADINAIDDALCVELRLKRASDYGHFQFPESQNDREYEEDSISWVALLHGIAYYSSIRIGKNSFYEIMGALYEMLELALDLPKSCISFLSDLLNYFERNGFYVYFESVIYRDTLCANEDMFIHPRGRYITNQSGLFEFNQENSLIDFHPDSHNIIVDPEVRRTPSYEIIYIRQTVSFVRIPDGIVSIKSGLFQRFIIKHDLVLPDSLHIIGEYAFADSRLPDIVIPEGFCIIGSGAFDNSIIKSIRFNNRFQFEYLYTLSGARIEKLYLPMKVKSEWQKKRVNYDGLFQARDIVFY